MEVKLYVGNLTYGTTEADLQTLFAASGTVKSVQIIKDRDSGQSKGFGFVEMTTQEEAQNAIKALNGKEVDGRALTVNLAKPREERGGGGRGGSVYLRHPGGGVTSNARRRALLLFGYEASYRGRRGVFARAANVRLCGMVQAAC